MESYRTRRRKLAANSSQSYLPFTEETPTAPHVAVEELPAELETDPAEQDFSFTIAIGRCADKPPGDDSQLLIDVSAPPLVETNGDARGQVLPESEVPTRQAGGLYPVAAIEERRLAAIVDGFCLLFSCGGFLALFGSLGGQFTFSKLSAAVYCISFALVYIQYFSLFTIFGGTTPGMMLRGLRVVDFSGEEPAPRQLFLRAMGYLLSAGTFFLGFLWATWDEDSLTWHDRVSHTYLSSVETLAETEVPGTAPLR